MAKTTHTIGRFFRPGPVVSVDELRGLPGLTHAEIKQQLEALHIGCQCHPAPLPALADNTEADTALEALIRQIWQLKGMPADITETITEAFAQHLWGGAKEGISLVDWETPDAAFLERLQQDVWQFSSAKNRTQMRSMAQALISPDGKLRTFAEFKEAADAIAVTHKTWLQAEYDLAVAGGQMGATWSRAEANKAALPLMQYNTAGDSRVRQAHIELDGVVRPVDDPFWDYWYPPNGWGCRCDVQSLAIGQVTPMEKVIIPDDVPLMFQTNLGKAGLIFPPTHPYYSI